MLSQLKEPICQVMRSLKSVMQWLLLRLQFLVELLHSKRDLASDEKKSNLFRQVSTIIIMHVHSKSMCCY